MKNDIENIKIPNSANKVIEILEGAGFDAYIVGGFIRDWICNFNTQNDDVDIATNASPEQVEQMFEYPKWATYPIGKKFGTIGVKQKGSNQIIEVTTFRSEKTYSDARHPDKVKFAKTIDEDLSRRDFTCNTIAYNPNTGLYDPFNGAIDIHNKVIRCVGDAQDRFAEDHLRILRALRFAAELGFKINEDAQTTIRNMKSHINKVSKERIRDELTKLLCGKYAKYVLTNYSDVIFEIIPELAPLYNFDQKTKYHSYDAWTHTIIVVDKTPPTKIGKWAALLHDIGKPNCFTIDENGQGHFYGHPKQSVELSKPILKRLKFSNKMSDSIMLLIRWHDQPMTATKKSVKKMLRKFAGINTEYNTEQMFRIFCDLRRADSYAHAENFREYLTFMDEVEDVFDQILAEEEAFSLHDLEIRGTDVIALGIPKGPKISEALNACLDAVINEEIPNTKQNLLDYISKNF